MHRNPFWLMAAAALSACSAVDRGVLDPVEQDGIELVSTHGLPNDTARLRTDTLTADVTGRWSDRGESIEIRYRAGKAPVRIAVTAKSTWNGATVPATAAWDRSVPEPGNAIGRPLRDAAVLQLAPGEAKLVQIEFDRTTKLDHPSIGDTVTVTVPMPAGAETTRFRVAGE